MRQSTFCRAFRFIAVKSRTYVSYYNKYGKAEVDPTNPRAFAVCDRCAIWTNLYKLKWQMQWNATQLFNTRFLVCEECYDTPQDQLRTVILPPDPQPVKNPRVEPFMYNEVDGLAIPSGSNGQDLLNPSALVTPEGNVLVADQASENFPD